MMSVLRLVLRNCGPLAANMFGIIFSHLWRIIGPHFCTPNQISESLENATPNATIRLQNVPLKKYAFILNICPDFYKSQQPIQKSS